MHINEHQRPQNALFGDASGMPGARPDPRPAFNTLNTNARSGVDPFVIYTQWTLSKAESRNSAEKASWGVVNRRQDPIDSAKLEKVVAKKQARKEIDKIYSSEKMTNYKREQIRRLAQDLTQRDYVPGYEWMAAAVDFQPEPRSNLTAFVQVILKRQPYRDPATSPPRRVPGFLWRDVVDVTEQGVRAEREANMRAAMNQGGHGHPYPGNVPINPAQRFNPWNHPANAGPRPFPQQQQPQQQPQRVPDMEHQGRSAPHHDFPPIHKVGQQVESDDSDNHKVHGSKKTKSKQKDKGGRGSPKIVQVTHSEVFDTDSASSSFSDADPDSISGVETDVTPDTLFSDESRGHRKEKRYTKPSPKGSPRRNMKASRQEEHGVEYRQHARPKRAPSPVRSAQRYVHEDVEVRPHRSSTGGRRRESMYSGGLYQHQRPTVGHSRGPSYDRDHQFGLPGRRGSLYETQRIKEHASPMIDPREIYHMVDLRLEELENRRREEERTAKFRAEAEEREAKIRARVREEEEKERYGRMRYGRRDSPLRWGYRDV